MTSPIPNSRSPRSNSDAVSSEEERGCAGGGGSVGRTGTGEAVGAVAVAGLSGAAAGFGRGPLANSGLPTGGFESGLAGAGLSGAAALACGDGAAGAGNSAVGARPEGDPLATRFGVASAAFPPAGAGLAPGLVAVEADDGAGLSAIFSHAGRISKKAPPPASARMMTRTAARPAPRGRALCFDCAPSVS